MLSSDIILQAEPAIISEASAELWEAGRMKVSESSGKFANNTLHLVIVLFHAQQ